MKIVQIIDSLHTGGAERVCVNLSNLFYQNNYDIKLIVFNQEGDLFKEVNAGVDVIIIDKKKNKLKALSKLSKEIKAADIVHTHMRQTYKFVKKACLLFGINKKIILHDHYGLITLDKSVPSLYTYYFKKDIYIGCTKQLTEWALEKVKIKESSVFLAQNFVLQKKCKEIAEDSKRDFVLIGTLKPVKNHIFAVKLAKRLNKNLTIYCPVRNNNYYKELKSQIETLEMSEQVTFIQNCTDVQSELHKYRYALMTSTSEADPLSLIEYLSQGLPVLSHNLGETAKIISAYYPEMVLDNLDIDKWEINFNAVKKIEKKEVLNIYENHFSISVFMEKYLTIYNQLLG